MHHNMMKLDFLSMFTYMVCKTIVVIFKSVICAHFVVSLYLPIIYILQECFNFQYTEGILFLLVIFGMSIFEYINVIWFTFILYEHFYNLLFALLLCFFVKVIWIMFYFNLNNKNLNYKCSFKYDTDIIYTILSILQFFFCHVWKSQILCPDYHFQRVKSQFYMNH